METYNVTSPRIRVDQSKKEGSLCTHVGNFELAVSRSNQRFHSMNAFEILKETVRILRFNCVSFMVITGLLIFPVSAVFLSNLLVDQSSVKRLSIRFLLVAKSSGLPLKPFVRHSCIRFAEMVVSSIMCFPLFVTLSLLSKAAVVYSVDCTYSRKCADAMNFRVIVGKIWRRIVSTYLWTCMGIVGCITLFCVLLLVVSSSFSVIGFSSELNFYTAITMGSVFSVVFANAIIICNIAIVISVLEDASGPQAVLRSSALVQGQTQVGLLIFLGSTIGTAVVEGLFEHRVKTLSYGDGSSKVWEGPPLVIMYSFVELIDMMMSAVFYFSCRSYRMEASDGESPSILEAIAVPADTVSIQIQ